MRDSPEEFCLLLSPVEFKSTRHDLIIVPTIIICIQIFLNIIIPMSLICNMFGFFFQMTDG